MKTYLKFEIIRVNHTAKLPLFLHKDKENGNNLKKTCKSLAEPKKLNTFALAFKAHRPASNDESIGEMVEWSITAVLKTAVPRGTGGSNPSLSAKSCKSKDLQDFYLMVYFLK